MVNLVVFFCLRLEVYFLQILGVFLVFFGFLFCCFVLAEAAVILDVICFAFSAIICLFYLPLSERINLECHVWKVMYNFIYICFIYMHI